MRSSFLEKYDYLILSVSTLILSVLLFFPVSSDLAAFIQGGMILNNGGSLYVDYFDVKPPMVFYIYDILYTLLGKNIYLYRLFDIVYQLTFLLSSIFILRKLQFKKSTIRVFAILMPLCYVTLNYANVLQMESLLFLPSMWYFYFCSMKSNSNTGIILVKGILLGIAINLKYTFGLLIVADLLISLSNNNRFKALFKSISVQLSVAILFTLVFFSPIIIKGNFYHFVDFWDYMKVYSNFPSLSFDYLIFMLKQITAFYSSIFSILFSLFVLIAIVFSQTKENYLDKKIIQNLLIFSTLLFITILIERKLLLYHQIRVYPFLIVLSSIGLVQAFEKIKEYKKITIVVIFLISIIFTPLPKLIYLFRLPYLYATQTQREYLSNFNDGDQLEIIKKHYDVANYINSKYDTNKTLLINTAGNELIIYLIKDYIYSIPNSAFYLNEKPSEILVEKAFTEMKDAEVVITQNDDSSYIMFFNNDSSYDALKKNDKLWNYLSDNFIQDTIIDDSFIIFKRNKK